eukprot:8222622-Pyramimonas_sp.AAC.1
MQLLQTCIRKVRGAGSGPPSICAVVAIRCNTMDGEGVSNKTARRPFRRASGCDREELFGAKKNQRGGGGIGGGKTG